jgi:DNA-directed RNA polymerase specialized sigma24 family protein
MPAPLTLEELVRTDTYRNARHRDLLATAPVLPWPQLAELQSAYVRTDHPLEKAEISKEFQRRVRTLADDEDEQAARAAEEAELEAILHAEPEEIDADEIGRGLDRSHRALLARDLRYGVTYGRHLTYREIAEELGCSPSTARRLVIRG